MLDTGEGVQAGTLAEPPGPVCFQHRRAATEQTDALHESMAAFKQQYAKHRVQEGEKELSELATGKAEL